MIATLRGTLIDKGFERIVVEVAGVGYQVFLSSSCYEQLPGQGDAVFLHIHTDVKEDAINLYGFTERQEKQMFKLLIGVSGVGPKLALTILSAVIPAELANAIAAEDVRLLQRIPGIGKKTAERLVLELKDKVEVAPVPKAAARQAAPADQRSIDVISGLINLGYPPVKARQAVENVRQRVTAEEFATLSLEELLRQSLRTLA